MGFSREVWFAAGAAVLPLAGAALYLLLNYDALPDPYPRHWDWRGVADAYGPKTEGAVFAPPLIGLVTHIIVLAAFAAHGRVNRDKPQPSSAQFIAVAWFGALVVSLVSMLPVIVPPAGAPWLLPAILAGAAAICCIGVRDLRRAKRAQQSDTS